MDPLHIFRNKRCRGVSLSVRADGTVRVSAHPRVSEREVRRFLAEKTPWILQAKERAQAKKRIPLQGPEAEYRRFRARALAFVTKRTRELSQVTGLTPTSVRIRNTGSRWGSCSRQGGLMFHYRLFFLPPELADYVILHELCHLKHFNHSAAFWQLLSRFCPSCVRIRHILQADGPRLAAEAACLPL